MFAVKAKLAGETLENEVKNVDVVLDCSDNFTTRFAINAACVRQKRRSFRVQRFVLKGKFRFLHQAKMIARAITVFTKVTVKNYKPVQPTA